MRNFEKINNTKPKQKKCVVCKNLFTPFNSTQKICSRNCAIKYAEDKVNIKIAKEKRKIATEKKMWHNENDKISVFENKLQSEINAIARAIDFGWNCISCKPTTEIKKAFGGHFHSVGSNKTLRYNLHNIHVQCYSCNGNKGGAPIQYLEGLERVYGSSYADYVHYALVRDFKILKLSREQIFELIKKAKKIRKSLEENTTQILTADKKIALRTEINKHLNIY